MNRPLFTSSRALQSNGQPYSDARFQVYLVSSGANREPNTVFLQSPPMTLVTDSDGYFPTDSTIEVPDSNAWQYRLVLPDKQEFYAFIEYGDGSPIEIDDWLSLSGAIGEEAGTPAIDWVIGFHEIVIDSPDHLMLETFDGDLRLTNQVSGYFMQKTSVPADETVVIPEGHQMVVFNNFDVDGTLDIQGQLVLRT